MPTHYSDTAMQMVDSIYAVAARQAPLISAVDAYAELMVDEVAGIFSYDSIIEHIQPEAFASEIWQLIDRYHQTHKQWNPLFKLGEDRLLAGEIVTAEELMPFPELVQTDYYKEVLAPLNMRYAMGCYIAGRGQTWLSLASVRQESNGNYTPEHFEYTELFRRHMARGLHILELGGEATLSPTALETSLANLPVGLMLVNDKRHIVASNERARSHFAGHSKITNAHNRLEVGSTRHKKEAFNAWWQTLADSAASDGGCYRSPELAPVWELEVSRINLNNTPGSNDRHWLVTLKESPELDQQLSPSYLQQRFSLSPSEAAVCLNLCRSGDAVSAATAMSLSPHTVRTHLKNIFKKTGTKNQVQLALKLTSFLR